MSASAAVGGAPVAGGPPILALQQDRLKGGLAGRPRCRAGPSSAAAVAGERCRGGRGRAAVKSSAARPRRPIRSRIGSCRPSPFIDGVLRRVPSSSNKRASAGVPRLGHDRPGQRRGLGPAERQPGEEQVVRGETVQVHLPGWSTCILPGPAVHRPASMPFEQPDIRVRIAHACRASRASFVLLRCLLGHRQQVGDGGVLLALGERLIQELGLPRSDVRCRAGRARRSWSEPGNRAVDRP